MDNYLRALVFLLAIGILFSVASAATNAVLQQECANSGGNQGSITYSSNTALNSNVCGTDITVDSGVTLNTNGYTIVALNSFTNYGTVQDIGVKTGNGANGINGESIGGGGGNGGSASWTLCTGGGGGGGGGPGAPGGSAGSSSGWLSSTPTNGGSNSGSGGNGGGNCASSNYNKPGSGAGNVTIYANNFINNGVIDVNGGNAGAGNYEGAGGGGAGYVYIYALGPSSGINAGVIDANGGNGGSASCPDGGSSAGGGGGGGGLIVINYPESDSVNTNYVSYSGGQGGADCGSGQNGANGASGNILLKPIMEYTYTFNAQVTDDGSFANGIDGTNIVTVDGVQYNVGSLPISLQFVSGSTFTYSYETRIEYIGKNYIYIYTFNSLSSNPSGYDTQSGTITASQNTKITALYNEQTIPRNLQVNPQCTVTYGSTVDQGSAMCFVNASFVNYYGSSTGSLTSSSGGSYSLSPTGLVNRTNQNTAPWLLTCPNPPEENPLDNSYFENSYGFIGGDACLIQHTQMLTNVSLPISIYWDNCNYPASGTVEPLNVKNASSTPSIAVLSYSPAVDHGISNGFNTTSYIFDQVPSFVQHGIWTWHAKYANFGLGEWPTQPETFTESGLLYNVTNTNSCPATNSLDFCNYTYTYTENTVLNNVANYYIPFNEVLNGNILDQNQFTTNILPFFIYSYSMPSLYGQSMSQSYDVFGPWNYYTPFNSIEPYPIDVGSRFYINYNSILESTPTNSLLSFFNNLPPSFGTSSLPGGQLINSIWNGLSGITGAKSPEVAEPIAITASPNDYVFVLNESSSTGAYYITTLRLLPRGYYNTSNYQPDTISTTTSSSAWNTEWNNYWNNVIGYQNMTTYVVSSIDLSSAVGSWFTPINIAADDEGDIFVTGFNNTAIQPQTAEPYNQPELVKISSSGSISYNAIQTPNSTTTMLPIIMPEIAVSPTGHLVFLANQSLGEIYVYSGLNFSSLGAIDLSYNNPNKEEYLNIYYWLLNGGLFNYTGYDAALPSYNPNTNADLDNTFFHHPIAITDINGYLYVLDNWAGAIGVNWASSGWWIFTTSTSDTGIFFDILTLRVINSTGVNVPINPTSFPDMFSSSECGSTTSGSTTSTCVYTGPFGSKGPSGSCPSGCVWQVYGGPCGFADASQEFHCVNTTGTILSNYTPLTTSGTGSGYPPYGWILSAAVTPATLNSGGSGCSKPYTAHLNGWVSFCSGNATHVAYGGDYGTCNYTPESMPKNYYGSFYPIGPALSLPLNVSTASNKNNLYVCQGSNNIGVGFSPDYWHNVGFSVNYNGTVDLIFGNYSNGIYNPNVEDELLITRMNVENYTKLFGGNSPYNCYTSNQNVSTSATNPWSHDVNVCSYMPAVKYMSKPIYSLTDPFKYLENLGSSNFLTLQGYYGSEFGGGHTPAGYSNSTINSSITSNLTHITSTFNANASTNVSKLQQLALQLNKETLSSSISGYVLVPYTYTYTITQQRNNFVLISSNTPTGESCPSPSSLDYGPVTTTQTFYTYALVDGSSNNLVSPVDGGATYLQYLYNSEYYVPNLSDLGLIIPPQILYNIRNNRFFGYSSASLWTFPRPSLHDDGYISSAPGILPAYVYYGLVLNATDMLNYNSIIHNQSFNGQIYPGYEDISSSFFGPVYGSNALQAMYDTQPAVASNIEYYLSQPILPNFAALFDWYKEEEYLGQFYTMLNSTTYNNAQLLGFKRIFYTFNDKFNNTIYMPLDADIANITTITLRTTPVVAEGNANSTTITINGTVGYYSYFGEKFTPLVGGHIYLYYGSDINFVGYNALQYPANATLCEYGSNAITQSSNCILSNPIWTGLQANSNVTTYAPSFNASGKCSMPSNSLLAPVNTIYTMCNIYQSNKYGLPSNCPNTPATPSNPSGSVQFCLPLFSNGTGICTSQLGLMDIATTNSIGDFTYNTIACGIQQNIPIIARFYGSPPPEPIYVNVTLLGQSALNPAGFVRQTVSEGQPITYYDMQYIASNVEMINYTWSPAHAATTIDIGMVLLSFGEIEALEIFAAVALVAAILLAQMHKSNKRRA